MLWVNSVAENTASCAAVVPASDGGSVAAENSPGMNDAAASGLSIAQNAAMTAGTIRSSQAAARNAGRSATACQ